MTLTMGSKNSQALESGSAHAVNFYVGKKWWVQGRSCAMGVTIGYEEARKEKNVRYHEHP